MTDREFQQLLREYHHIYTTTKPKPPSIRIHLSLIFASFIVSFIISLFFIDKVPFTLSSESYTSTCLEAKVDNDK